MSYHALVDDTKSLDLMITQTADWIYRERDITAKNFPFVSLPKGTYKVDLCNFEIPKLDQDVTLYLGARGIQRISSLQIFLAFIKGHPGLLLQHPIASGATWISPDGFRGVVYADISTSGRPILGIHYTHVPFSPRFQFLV